MNKVKRQSISLRLESQEQLKELAEQYGSENAAIAKAIATEHFIRRKIREGKIILVWDPKTDDYDEVVFR